MNMPISSAPLPGKTFLSSINFHTFTPPADLYNNNNNIYSTAIGLEPGGRGL
jgi:hypothetical protein